MKKALDLFIAAIILFSALSFAQTSAAPAKEAPLKKLPYTPGLDVTSMDRSADPCVDFYTYSCGGWIKRNPIPPDQASWSVYGKLSDQNQRFLWGLLQDAAKPSPQRNAVQQKIGDFFSSCMDEAAVEKAGAKPLEPAFRELAAIKTVTDLAPWLARQHLVSFGYTSMMFGFGSNQDFADSTRVIAFASASGLGLPDRDYYLKPEARMEDTRKHYVAYVQKMFELLGDSPAEAAQEAQTVMRIETAMAKASFTRVELRDPYKTFHKMNRVQLQALTPSFGWNAYLDAAGVGQVQEFNVTEPEFFKELQKLLESEPLANWKTYFRWHVARQNAPYLSTPFVNANFEFYSRYLQGTEQIRPRWKRCVSLVNYQLSEAVGQEYVARTFGPELKARTLRMTGEIEAAMASEIKALDWMGPETKQQALTKLHAVVNKIGYPDRWRDYSSVRIARGDFFGNFLRATEFESRRQLNKIGKPVDRGEWMMPPSTVNAYYDPQMNDINFPAAVLQPPLFDPRMDDAPNYGNTGSTIGHELTHGFDDQGRQFDDKGNLRDWWTKQDAQHFEQRAQCVVDQYAKYIIVDDIPINSKLTEGEDVADLGGTVLAYIAWKNATAGQELHPIGGFTPEQRFFIGFAQWACENERPENLRLSAVTNQHSPGKYRINGVVVNVPEFGRAFGCKAGQPMVKDQPCKVW
ncbi:MAG: M13 family metallopeptidase [Candidatus Korobacteraceae bacterium]|jgi:endothelin-converting enzyme/putative endopeptidase